MPSKAHELSSPNQRERLWQIDFLARFRGYVTRSDLVLRFGIAPSNATRDFTLYRSLAPANLDYDHRDKVYRCSRHFKSLFTYDREHTLQTLSLGQGVGLDVCQQPVLVDAAPTLNQPDLDVLATVSRAIYEVKALQIQYVSVSSGESSREIVPHSLVNTGMRWHVRGFCRQHQDFRDFVMTRIVCAEPVDKDVHPSIETIGQDDEWNRFLAITLQPHPAAAHRRAIELDYGLAPQASLQLNVRAATVGYLMRRWGVDCSVDAKLSPEEYQLALNTPDHFNDVSNMVIAPGFTLEPSSQ